MKKLRLAKEKWYQSEFSVFRNDEKIGYLSGATFKKSYTLIWGGVEFTIKSTNIWKGDQAIYQGNIKLADVIQKPFKGENTLILQNGERYYIKQNIWKSTYTLSGYERELGVIKSHTFSHDVTVGDSLPDNILCAFILLCMNRSSNAAIYAALIPIFIVVLS